MADEQERRAARLRVAHEIERGGAHLRDRAGRCVQGGGPDRLDGIDGDDRGRGAGFERAEDVFDAGGGAERHARLCHAHPRGTHTHLRHRFFAGDVDRVAAGERVRRERLQDEGGLADARIAADQHCRARHQAAAADAVEFRNAGRAAWRQFICGLQILQCERPAFRPACTRAATNRNRGRLFDNRVPPAAGFAPARPFGMRRAAGLASERCLCAGHDSTIAQSSRAPRRS